MAHFVICNLVQNSGILSGVSVSVLLSRKRSWRGTWETPATFGFGARAAQLPSSPPRTSPCLSPSLGASRVGCRLSPTCGHAALHRAEERAGGAATRARRGREAQGAWRWVKRTKTEHWCNGVMEKRRRMANWSERHVGGCNDEGRCACLQLSVVQ